MNEKEYLNFLESELNAINVNIQKLLDLIEGGIKRGHKVKTLEHYLNLTKPLVERQRMFVELINDLKRCICEES